MIPDKTSDLIIFALDCLREYEKDLRYEIDMMSYHHPVNGKCHICLVGAVMARLGADPKELLSKARFGPDVERKLEKLDWAVCEATGYVWDNEFYKKMEKKAKRLAKLGD